MTKYFRSGEFAKLCRVSKDTVLYYDKIGLLKPDFINDKGYRYYSNNKIIEMYTIKLLRDSRIPLDEIIGYINGGKSTTAFFDLMKKNLELLYEKRRKLDYVISSIENGFRWYEYYKGRELQKIYLEERSEEYYIASDLISIASDLISDNDSYSDIDENDIQVYNEHLDYIYNLGIDFCYFEGYCFIEEEDLVKAKFLSYLFKKVDCDRLWVKPPGKYIALLTQEVADEVGIKALQQIKDYAKEHNYKLSRDIYCFELMNYEEFENEEDFVFLYEVMVE